AEDYILQESEHHRREDHDQASEYQVVGESEGRKRRDLRSGAARRQRQPCHQLVDAGEKAVQYVRELGRVIERSRWNRHCEYWREELILQPLVLIVDDTVLAPLYLHGHRKIRIMRN